MTTETETAARHGEPWGLGDALALALIVAAGSALTLANARLRPDRVAPGGNFLFGEPGINLAVADILNHGGRLYRDLSIPYGPLPSYAHALLARGLGNTVSTFALFLALASLAQLPLCYLFMRICVTRSTALAVTLVGLVPAVLVPAGLMTGMENAYSPVERCVIVLAFLAWRPPGRRGVGRSCLLGALIGSLQWVRFGTAAFVALPVALLELAAWFRPGLNKDERRRLGRALLATALGAVVVEAARALAALALLPGPIARDVIWPLYTQRHYSQLGETPLTLLGWSGWGLFLGQQLAPLTALALALAGLGALLARGRAGALAEWRLMLPLGFFIPAFFFLFTHAFNTRKAYWCLFVSAAYLIDRLPRPWRWAALLSWAPALFLMLKIIFVNGIAPEVRSHDLPDGQRVFLTQAETATLEEVLATLDVPRDRPRAPVLMVGPSGMFPLTYGLPLATRHAFVIPAYVRDHDTEALLLGLGSAQAIVSADTRDVRWESLFNDRVCAAIRRRIARTIDVGARGRVFVLGREAVPSVQ